jgi:ribonuclease P protein component
MKRSLTRRERLSNKQEIKTLFQNAEKRVGRNLKLLFRGNDREYNRILITVQRGSKSAVSRNRKKRILREIYRNYKNSMKQGFDLVFILKNDEFSFDEMYADFTQLIEQARLRGNADGE